MNRAARRAYKYQKGGVPFVGGRFDVNSIPGKGYSGKAQVSMAPITHKIRAELEKGAQNAKTD